MGGKYPVDYEEIENRKKEIKKDVINDKKISQKNISNAYKDPSNMNNKVQNVLKNHSLNYNNELTEIELEKESNEKKSCCKVSDCIMI